VVMCLGKPPHPPEECGPIDVGECCSLSLYFRIGERLNQRIIIHWP